MDDRIVEILERIEERLANIEEQTMRFGEFVLEVSPSEVKEDIKDLEEVLEAMGEPIGKKHHSSRKKRVA